MPKIKNEEQDATPKKKWVIMDALKDYVVELRQRYNSQLFHIQPENMLYAGFSKPVSTIWANVRPIKEAFSLFLNECYILSVHIERWEKMGEAERYRLIFHELLHIPEGGFSEGDKEYKKLVNHDLQDFTILVEKCGVYNETIEDLISKT